MPWPTLRSRARARPTASLDPNDYAFGGGGFPILLRGTGMIGVVAVSGLTHWEDHALVVRCIEAFLG